MVLSESVALALDAALLDDTADDATRPRACETELRPPQHRRQRPPVRPCTRIFTLAGLVALVAGSSPIVFVASPMQAPAIKMRQPNFAMRYWRRAACGWHGHCGRFQCAGERHRSRAAFRGFGQRDTSSRRYDAASIGVAGSPNTVAAPTKSLWQSDLLSIRLVLEASWALRTSGGLAWVEDAIGDDMNDVAKRQLLTVRIERLKEHIERVGNSPAFAAALAADEAALREVEQRKEQPR